ncbi:sugar ABC transporter ATP-binding protein [Leucobacter sp. CSA1]|uniref:Sugar ABC transporter ATP-binding protein n=1 Tax=Leucobacter chromiisoli TaxID=2796471 RepID=A0A934Q638_9MICO|nr:sugar ABC transporter ATP-binding protein [Leucobacter chromiisoli]MBK0418358.1 sugar ABC transporter ATP-binding protein [Leucobacter chromiisoli]
MSEQQPTEDSRPADSSPPRVALRGISKRFGAVRAIRHADLVVRPGSVHALVGENGAGKSTLIKILAGAEVPDQGGIEIDGSSASYTSTSGAIAAGIATVYQEPQLFGELTVAENIFIGRELRAGGRIDWKQQKQRVDELLDIIGLPQRYATRVVDDLSIASRQQVAIAKALAQDASVLILDEPSAILTDAEIDVLFGVVRRLRERGVAIIYISHRLDELFRIADDITVMRDGRTVGTHSMADMTVRSIAEAMVGGIEVAEKRHVDLSGEKPLFELRKLARGEDFSDVNVSVAPGEIVALYGLVGSGASEVAASIWGMKRATGGEIMLDGEVFRPRSPRHVQKKGIALLPADRKGQGMFGFQSIAFNISAGSIGLLTRFGIWFDRARERKIAVDLVKRLAVKTPSEKQPIGALSGGNAQKVVLARQLVERPRLLVLEEPTQGVDVGAKEEIHSIVTELAESGVSVLVVTTDLPEALRLADRIVVVRDGTTTVTFGPDATQVDLLAAAAGDEEGRAA